MSIVVGMLALATSAFAQAADDPIEKALTAAPRNLREGATVVKWNQDFTYETLRKGTNRLVCYDQSGWATEQPFSVQCTSIANLDRVAQNKKFEATADAKARAAALEAAEKDGSRIKPEFGSVFYTVSGPNKDQTRTHVTVAVPNATAQTLGLPDNNKMGGVWIMGAGTSGAHLMIPGS
jgi:hypothetical protein